MSNTNSFRQVGAGKTFLSPTDFLVQVVTSDGSSQLVLPKIATILDSYTTIYQYMGIRFVDISDNASVNNIELIGFENDKINGESSITIDTNGGGGILTLIGNGQWAYTPNGSSSASSYLFQETPFEIGYPSFTQGGDVLGIVNDKSLTYNPPYVILSNGNVAQLGLVQTILGGSIYIFQAWDYETADPTQTFYWVAMKQSSTNPQKLEYICDLLWTTQFLNEFYIYIKNTSTSNDLSCTYINYTAPNTDTDPIEVYKTILSYSNGVLTAVDSLDDFGGATFLSLYNSLTGAGAVSLNLNYTEPLFSANSDFGQMLNPNGNYSGYIYYWDNNESPYVANYVGYNILTGETRLVLPIVGLGSVTNFNGDIIKAIVDVISHPKGCFFILDDGLTPDNLLNYDGVTSIWSPDITNNTIVKYINNRNEFGQYASTNGGLDDNTASGIAYVNAPYDNGYLYCYDSPVVTGNCTNLVAYRFAFDYADEGSYEVVSLPFNNVTQANPIQAVASFPTDNGMLMASLIVPAIQQYSYNFHWVYWNNAQINPSQLQLNAYAPTNYFGNTIFGTTINYSAVNWNSYGVTYDKYNQTF
jgi:hypothetical protein